MKLLAIETSGLRGSVALSERLHNGDIRLCAYRRHEVYNQHAERMLSLVTEAFDEAGWKRSDVDRVAVGLGPGSFAGVRIALALAQGLMLGLAVPGVGLGSLAVVAAGLSKDDQRTRVVIRDARREEFFLAVYSPEGKELIAPYAIAQVGARELLEDRFFSASGAQEFGQCVILGTEVEGLPCALNDETTEADARPLARAAFELEPSLAPIEPQYVRGPNIVRPQLPDSPLNQPRKS